MPARPVSLAAREPKRREPLPGFGTATARIAHRFAPRAQVPTPPSAPAPRPEAPQAKPLADLGISPRTLIGGLIALALLPNLTIAGYLLLPARDASETERKTAIKATASASLAAVAPEVRARPAKVRSVQPVLSVPASLEASASGDIPLTLELDGTDGVPARSSIAISGLPQGATLSGGRPYGTSGWNLKSDEIGDLSLHLPDDASGETKIAIELIAPQGEILSRAETVLKVSASPEGEEVALEAEEEKPPRPAPSPRRVATVAVAPSIPEPVQLGTKAATETAAAEPSRSRGTKPMALASANDSAEADADTIIPAKFVNLRSGPTSSASVVAVVPKGAKLAVQDRKKGWVQVTHPTSGETGWIYAGNLEGAPRRTARRSSKPAETESFWSQVGRALQGEPATSTAN